MQFIDKKCAEDFRGILEHIIPDINREGMKDTPARYINALREMLGGYHMKPSDVIKLFEDGAAGVDEMVTQVGIPVYSLCEHHLLPFFGTVDVAYIPGKRIVGLSKVSRLVDVFATRAQVQERLTGEIADALMTHLEPKGVGVAIHCRHMCMEIRGIKQANIITHTTALRGIFKTSREVRAEFLDTIRK